MPIQLAGSPRSTLDLAFAASLLPCANCFARCDASWTVRRDGGSWIASVVCPVCDVLREYSAPATKGAISIPPLEVGGPSASSMFTSQALTDEIERLQERIHAKRGAHGPGRDERWRWIVRALTALNELEKFIGRGTDTLSTRAFTMMRSYVTAERENLHAAIDSLATSWRGTAVIETEFRRMPMAGVSFDGTSVSRSQFDRSVLDRSSWSRAIVARSTFVDASLVGAHLASSRFHDCDFRGATFADATVTGARFERCTLDDSTRAEITAAGALVIGAAVRIAL